MTLQEAIEEVKLFDGEFTENDVWAGQFLYPTCEAIATILNAVVKGELK